MVNKIRNAAIVLEEDPQERVTFQLMPESITDTKSVSWSDIPIAGRSEPIKVYAGCGPRSFSFSLTFCASVDQGDYGEPEEVVNSVSWLQSLAYPVVTRNSRLVTTPPVVILVVANLLSSRCVVRDVSVEWKGPWFVYQTTTTVSSPGQPYRSVPDGTPPIVDLPMVATVNLNLDEVNEAPLDSVFIRTQR